MISLDVGELRAPPGSNITHELPVFSPFACFYQIQGRRIQPTPMTLTSGVMLTFNDAVDASAGQRSEQSWQRGLDHQLELP